MDSRTGKILEKVMQLYQRYGIKSVTMDDVAKHLCISKKTLYEHFADKEDLVKHVMLKENEKWFLVFNEIRERDLNAIDEVFEVYQVIKQMFREYNPSMEYDLKKYYPDLSMQLRTVRRKMIYDSSYRNLVKGKKEGLYRKEINAKLMARFHLFKMENIMDTDLFTIGDLTSFKVFHELFVYHLQGIMSPEGRVLFEENYRKFRGNTGDQS